MWFFGKTKKLKTELEEKNKELEELRAALAEKEGLLGEKMEELDGSKKRIADFEARQSSISSAMTEATLLKERILREAREEAARLEAEGKKRREEFITDGRGIEERAQENAEKTLEAAREQARKDTEKTFNDAENAISEAERLSKMILEEAEKSAHSMIDEAEAHVKAREDRLVELNERLKERAEMALKDAEFYADTLDSVTGVRARPRIKRPLPPMSETEPELGETDGEAPRTAAALMQSIYRLEGRAIPSDEEAGAGDDFSMPSDPGLAELVDSVLNK